MSGPPPRNSRRLRGLDSDGKRLRVSGRAKGCASKAALQQRHQSRAPVPDDEEQQEWNRNVVLVVNSVVDRGREVGADQQFEPWNPSQALAVLGGADFVLLRDHAVFGRSG